MTTEITITNSFTSLKVWQSISIYTCAWTSNPAAACRRWTALERWGHLGDLSPWKRFWSMGCEHIPRGHGTQNLKYLKRIFSLDISISYHFWFPSSGFSWIFHSKMLDNFNYHVGPKVWCIQLLRKEIAWTRQCPQTPACTSEIVGPSANTRPLGLRFYSGICSSTQHVKSHLLHTSEKTPQTFSARSTGRGKIKSIQWQWY